GRGPTLCIARGLSAPRLSRFRPFAGRIIPVSLPRSFRGRGPVAWRISYRHPLRPDDGGLRFVPDQSEAAAEKLRLELRGYAVTKPTQAAALRLIAQTGQEVTGEAVRS